MEECRGDWEAARRAYHEACIGFEQTQQPIFAPLARADLGRVLARQREWDAAAMHLLHAQEAFGAYAFPYGAVLVKLGLGMVTFGRGDAARARADWMDAFGIAVNGAEYLQALLTLGELVESSGLHPLYDPQGIAEFLAAHPATPAFVRARAERVRNQIGATKNAAPKSFEEVMQFFLPVFQ
ncbi:MAG: hypothetical protein HY741_26385 [Chloroflexi bacterium]|nr:hypothetical protein [Chloroflexota bacterium]